MLRLPEIIGLTTVEHPLAVSALYGACAVAGVLVGGIVNARVEALTGRLGSISSEFQPVLAIGVLAAAISALGWSLLWSLPLTGLAIVAAYVAIGLVLYQPRRWPLLDGIMAGLFCGFVMSLGAITIGLIDPGLI